MDQTTIDNLSAQRFVHYLVTPFSQWEAHRIGLIDNDGKLKRPPKDQSEAKFFNMFHQLVIRIKDLLKTSGRGTNWVLPSSAGNFYLGNKNLPTTNFTNWSISNKSSLPIFGAAYSAMKECIELNDADEFNERFEFYIDKILNEDDVGNNSGQVSGLAPDQSGAGMAAGPSWSGYVNSNKEYTARLKKDLKKKKSAAEIFDNINSMVNYV